MRVKSLSKRYERKYIYSPKKSDIAIKLLKRNLVFHIARRLVHHVNKIHQILQSRGVQTAQFMEWRSQLRVTDQFTKRV